MKRIFSNSKERSDFFGESLLSQGKIDAISIASPFLSETDLLNMLIHQKCRIRLVVRLCVATSFSALEQLLNAENVCVRYYVDKHFHSKIYIVNNEYAVIGSSNFTNGGLQNNREINIQIPSEDKSFSVITDIFEEYWNCADTLTLERLEKFKSIILMHMEKHEKLETDLLVQLTEELEDTRNDNVEDNRGKRASRILTEEWKMRIGEANRGKKRPPLSEERRKQLSEAVSIANSKPVVCVDTGQRYASLTTAAREFYNYERGYGYIGDVCKGNRFHYKKHVWRFADDYDLMTDDEKRNIINKLEELFSKELIIKDAVEKWLFRGRVFDSQSELVNLLISEGVITNRTSISSLIIQNKKKGCSFLKITSDFGVEHIYFADYIQMYSGKDLIEEEPVGLSLEELAEYYASIFDIPIEDAKVIDILSSAKDIFFEIDGKYYKSEKHLRENNSYDYVLSKNEVLSLLRSNQCELLWDATHEEIVSSKKKQYYLKNKYIFRNQPEYVNKFIKVLSKDELLIKLGIER